MARKLYTSDMLAIQQAWEAGNVERMGDLLGRHIPEHGQRDWRGFEWDVFQRHLQRARPFRSFSCSDNPYLVTATPDGRTLTSLVYVHAPHPDDERVEFILWDASTGWKPRIFEDSPEGFSSAIALSPDGRVFATGSDVNGKDGKPQPITLWSTATGKPIRKGPSGCGANVTFGSLAFLPDGKKLIWAGTDSKIHLWDLETEKVRSFEGHKGVHCGVALHPGGRLIASATNDGIVRLWDIRSGSEVHTFTNLGFIPLVTFSPDGRYLAVGSWSGVRMWDLTRPQDLREVELKGRRNEVAMSPSFSPDGRYLAAGSGSAVKMWEVDGGELRATLRGHSLQVFWTRFLDGGRILASGSEDRTVKLWDVAQALAERDVLKAHSGSVDSLAFEPDDMTLFSGGSDGEIGRWDVATGRKLGRIGVPGLKWPARSLAVSFDGRTLADSRVGLWDLKTGELITLASGDAEAGYAVAFSPVGSVLAKTDHPIIRLWDVVTKKPLHSLPTPPQHGVASMSFSPNGRILASAGWDSKVTLWEVSNGQELTNNIVGHAAGIMSVAFSPDGRTLASGSRDGTVMIWDVTDAAKPSLQHKLNANAGSVWAVAYSPDGKSIASGHDDWTVKLWDPVTERERCTLVGHTGAVRALAFSPKGSVLATGDAGGTIRLWRR
jgi:WD40 repeat protein